MLDTKNIKVGMLVLNVEGQRMGRVVERFADHFLVETPGPVLRERAVVIDEDVVEVHGGQVVLREGPGTLMNEREFEARRSAKVRGPRLGEGWALGHGPELIPEQLVQVGMVVRNVERRPLGTVTLAGESHFELHCDADDQTYSVLYGDVLNVYHDEVIVRMGAVVLRERWHEDRPASDLP